MLSHANTPGSGSRAWITLHMENLRHNIALLQSKLPAGCTLMPAVKANAYGHGAVPVARELNRLGVRAFCVATAQEGVELRRRHIRGVILVLGYTPPEHIGLVLRYGLTQTVVDQAYARMLDELGRPIRVHIGVDTGMHRLGERWENTEQLLGMLRMKHLRVEGIFTHLGAADLDTEAARAFTHAQAEAFTNIAGLLRAYGPPRLKTHLLNSGGLLRYPELGGDYARVGIALYGAADEGESGLRPVLSLHARVSSVRELHRGEYAGYGLAFRAERDSRIAALTIGYADGLPRALSRGAGAVLLNGRRAPIVGQICMDQTLVDVTDIPGIKAGDTATLIGTDGGETISVREFAAQAGTIANEILSRLGPRLERVIAAVPSQKEGAAIS